jgi:hypothetical protein
VAAVAAFTPETVAVNVALVAPAATVTDDGTETSALLLAKATLRPPVGASAVRVTVHESVAGPVIDELEHNRVLSAPSVLNGAAATPVPLRLTVEVVLPAPAPLVSVAVPLALPVAVGVNASVSVSAPPAGTLAGKEGGFTIEKPPPVT